jgi:DNA-binding transcriptional ArsR family regulator
MHDRNMGAGRAAAGREEAGMKQFVCLPSEMLQAELSTGATKALLGLLSYRNRKTGQCNPRIEKLSKRLGGASDSTVRRWLRELRQAGILEATKQRGKANSYRILCPVTNDRTGPVKNDRTGPPYPYMNQKKLEPAAKERVPVAAAAAVSPKPPASANLDEHTVSIVRQSLQLLARETHMRPPDEDLVRRVIKAARGAPGDVIHETLVSFWKRGRLATMRSWGLLLTLLDGCFEEEIHATGAGR